MSDIKIETLNKVYAETLNQPNLYHHLCFGGGSVKMLDIYTTEKTYTCKYQGDDIWTTPACKDCNGSVACDTSLTKNQELENYGMTKIYENLLKKIKNPPKRKPLPDGTLPMTDEEKYELCKMMGYENISEIFYDNKLHFKCFDKGWGIIVDVKAILYLANLFDLEV